MGHGRRAQRVHHPQARAHRGASVERAMQQTVATQDANSPCSRAHGKECRRRREAGRTHRPVERRTNEHSSHDNPTLLYLFDLFSCTSVVLLFPRIRVLSRRNEASPRCRNRSYFQNRPKRIKAKALSVAPKQPAPLRQPHPSSPSEPTLAQSRSQPLAPKVRWAPSSRLRGAES